MANPTLELLKQIGWDIIEDRLDDGGPLLIQGVVATPQQIQRLNTEQIPLRTNKLVLNLQGSRYNTREVTAEFETGQSVTPMEILGAIHSFYRDDMLTKEELDIIDAREEDVFEYVARARERLNNGERVSRIDIMGDARNFEGVTLEEDGSFTVDLGS